MMIMASNLVVEHLEGIDEFVGDTLVHTHPCLDKRSLFVQDCNSTKSQITKHNISAATGFSKTIDSVKIPIFTYVDF